MTIPLGGHSSPVTVRYYSLWLIQQRKNEVSRFTNSKVTEGSVVAAAVVVAAVVGVGSEV